MFKAFYIINLCIRLYSYALLIYIFMQYISPQNQFTYFLRRICEPMLGRVRQVLYKKFPQLYRFPLDFSPLVIFFGLNILQWIVADIFRLLM